MAIEVKVPVLPESVSDATIATWHKKAGDAVKRDENLVDLETDKVVLEVPSPVDGVLKEIKFSRPATPSPAQQVIAIIEEGAVAAAPAAAAAAAAPAAAPKPLQPQAKAAAAHRRRKPHRRRPAPTCRRARAVAATTQRRRTRRRRRHRPPRPRHQGRPGQLRQRQDRRRDRRRAPGRARADDAHAHAHRRAPDAVARTRIAMLTSFNEVNLRQGHGDAQGAGRILREGQRHQARLHELLRQGRRERAAAPPDRQRLGRRQRRDLPRLRRHLDRGVHRQGPGHAGAAQRRAHELRRHRKARSPITPRRRATAADARGPAGRHLHHHQRRHLRLADVHADRQPAAERDPRHARHQGARRSSRTARSSPRR